MKQREYMMDYISHHCAELKDALIHAASYDPTGTYPACGFCNTELSDFVKRGNDIKPEKAFEYNPFSSDTPGDKHEWGKYTVVCGSEQCMIKAAIHYAIEVGRHRVSVREALKVMEPPCPN